MLSRDATIIELTNYLVHVSNNVTLFPNIFHPQLVESADVKPTDMEDQLNCPPWHPQSPLHSPTTPGSSTFRAFLCNVPSRSFLGLSFCTDLQCGGPRLAKPQVQMMGMRPGPVSGRFWGLSPEGPPVTVLRSRVAQELRASGKLASWCPD